EGGPQLTRQKFASKLFGLIGVRLGGYVMESPNKAEKERPENKKKMQFVPYTYRLVSPSRPPPGPPEPEPSGPDVTFLGVEPFVRCDYCGKHDGVIHHVRDNQHLGRPSMNLHEECVGP